MPVYKRFRSEATFFFLPLHHFGRSNGPLEGECGGGDGGGAETCTN